MAMRTLVLLVAWLLASCASTVPSNSDGGAADAARDGVAADVGPSDGQPAPREARDAPGPWHDRAVTDRPGPGDRGPAADRLGPADASADPLVVVTSRGALRGRRGNRTRAFLGVPYAAAPVGGLRWKAPQPHPSWPGVRDAPAFGPLCQQLPGPFGGGSSPAGSPPPPSALDEDCLSLNIWTPDPPPTTPAPVMVWIHSGGFVGGGSSIALVAPPGERLARDAGVVVVSLNYRLGPFGFLANPALGADSGNYGIQDQQAALEWVQREIAGFGGDLRNVTLFGESAGSMSVCIHLTSARSKGLFHRAIMESGACPEQLQENSTVVSHPEAEEQGGQLATALGCSAPADIAACLRAKTAQEVLGALPLRLGVSSEGVSWGPNIDGTTLTGQPYDLVKGGSFHRVPVILGSNQDEWMFFIALAGQANMTTSEYASLVAEIFGYFGAGLVLQQYPAYPTATAAWSELMSDLVFICPTRRSARALAAAGVPAYLYHFATHPSFSPPGFEGAYHIAEIPFVFHTPPAPAVMNPGEDALAAKMVGYFTRFARSGNPNGQGEASWPAYTQQADPHLQLDLTISQGSQLRMKRCDFWDRLTTM
jgi:para-nitrobenzyl esterase